MHQRGYPDDRRRRSQRRKAAADHLGFDFEYLAGRVMARLTGEYVVLQDDGSSNGMPDLRIEYADGRVGYGEAWRDVAESYAAMSDAIAAREFKIAANGLDRVWWLRVSGDFRLRRVEPELPELLADLAAEGELFEHVAGPENLKRSLSPTVGRARKMGIVGLASCSVNDGEEAMIHLIPQGIGGPRDVTWEPFLEWVNATVSAPKTLDNRRKLDLVGGDERHLFIGVTFTSPWAAFRALTYNTNTLPPLSPALPKEITHLWIMGAQIADRCLAWYPDAGWFDPTTRWATE